jgi:sugar (pentulose or hexulose) kinase
MLPEVVAIGTPHGTVCDRASQLAGLPTAARIIAGTTDSTAASLAAGATAVGEAVTSLGSTLVLKLVSEGPLFAPGYGIYSHRLFDAWLVGGASNSGGRVLRRFFTDAQMQDLTAQLDPGRPTRLDYYPLLERRERFPTNDPHLEPRIRPIPDQTARLFQGLLEGIARIEQAGYQRLAELGAGGPEQVFTSGGGARNPAWSQIREQHMGVPIRSALHEQPAFGAALIAKHGGGRKNGAASPSDTARRPGLSADDLV